MRAKAFHCFLNHPAIPKQLSEQGAFNLRFYCGLKEVAPCLKKMSMSTESIIFVDSRGRIFQVSSNLLDGKAHDITSRIGVKNVCSIEAQGSSYFVLDRGGKVTKVSIFGTHYELGQLQGSQELTVINQAIIVISVKSLLIIEHGRKYVYNLADEALSINHISISSSHLLYISKKGLLMGIGAGDKGALGIDYFLGGKRNQFQLFTSKKFREYVKAFRDCEELSIINNSFPSIPFKIEMAFAGKNHSWAIIAGAVYQWGCQQNKKNSIFNLLPQRKTQSFNFRSIISNEDKACAIDYYGNAYYWNKQKFSLIELKNTKAETAFCGQYGIVIACNRNFTKINQFISPIIKTLKEFQDNKVTPNKKIVQPKRSQTLPSKQLKIGLILQNCDQVISQSITTRSMQGLAKTQRTKPSHGFLTNREFHQKEVQCQKRQEIQKQISNKQAKHVLLNVLGDSQYLTPERIKYQAMIEFGSKKSRPLSSSSNTSMVQVKRSNCNHSQSNQISNKYNKWVTQNKKFHILQSKAKRLMEYFSTQRKQQQDFKDKEGIPLNQKTKKLFVLIPSQKKYYKKRDHSQIKQRRIALQKQKYKDKIIVKTRRGFQRIHKKKIASFATGSKNFIVVARIMTLLKRINQQLKLIQPKTQRLYKSVLLIQNYYRHYILKKYLGNLKQQNIFGYIKGIMSINRIKKQFLRKKKDNQFKSILQNFYAQFLSRRAKISLNKFHNALKNIKALVSYNTRIRQICISALSLQFDIQLVRRSRHMSLPFQISCLSRFLQESAKKDHSRLKEKKCHLNPPAEVILKFKKKWKEVSWKNCLGQIVHKQAQKQAQTYFKIPNPSLKLLLQTNRTQILKNKIKITAQDKELDSQTSKMFRQLSYSFFKERNQTLPLLNLIPTKCFISANKLSKHDQNCILSYLKSYNKHQLSKKKSQKISRLFTEEQELGYSTLLIFSLHLGSVDPQLEVNKSQHQKYKIFKIISQFSPLYFREFFKYQIRTKYQLMFRQYMRIKRNYLQEKKAYQLKMIKFYQKNQEKINLLRTKVMMDMDKSNFKDIITREQIIRRGYSLKRKEDGLPFSTLVLKFAESLPEAPQPPTLQLRLENIASILREYVHDMTIATAMSENCYLIKKLGME